ncbi:MAG TPA: DNA polymerase IV [Acidimicrobiales bacterium]|nr:DNA polymerase IV [Acidimicrobiales bacterium]
MTILHVDMDAFFVSVEMLDNPDLRGKPVIVGGTGERGVVAAASYEARFYGVHSAMPSVRARRLCPHALFVRGRYDRYEEVSRAVFAIFRDITPLVEGISLDEAFLDVTGALRLFGDGKAIGHEIRRRVLDEQGLTCSVGVAARKLTAKLASEAAKPKATAAGPAFGDGVKVVDEADEVEFLHAHPIRALWGVGPATATRLERLAVRTVGDLAALREDAVVAALGQSLGRHLYALAWARDERPVEPDLKPKSVGHEETFAKDLHTVDALDPELVRMADSVGARLRRSGLQGRTVQLKVRFRDFATITRSETVATAVDEGALIARVARRLLHEVDTSPGVRLLGVSVSQLEDASRRQLSLDDAVGGSWDEVAGAVERIRERFGDSSIVPATMTGRGTKRRGEQQWGPDHPGEGAP